MYRERIGLVIEMYTAHYKLLTVYLIVFPSQALRYPYAPPFLFGQQAQRASIFWAEILFRNHLEKWLGQNDMSIFVHIVRISIRVVYPKDQGLGTTPCKEKATYLLLDVLFEFHLSFILSCRSRHCREC